MLSPQEFARSGEMTFHSRLKSAEETQNLLSPCCRPPQPWQDPLFSNADHQPLLLTLRDAACADHPCESCRRLTCVKTLLGAEAENRKDPFSSALCSCRATADTPYTSPIRPVKRVMRVQESSGLLATVEIFLLHHLSPIILPGLVQPPLPALLGSQVCNRPQWDPTGKSVSVQALPQGLCQQLPKGET